MSYYKLLGVEQTASNTEIKKSYHALALELHPDKTGNDAKKTAKFKLISEAYEVLMDDIKRAEYDRTLGALPASATFVPATTAPKSPTIQQQINQAAAAGDIAALEAFFARGLKLEPDGLIEHGGLLPIFAAIKGKQLKVVEWLLEHGCNINKKFTGDGSKYGYCYDINYLFSTVFYRTTDIMNVLLLKGINVNDSASTGQTPLIVAAKWNVLEAAKLLLATKGINVNARDDGGRTALIFASDGDITRINKDTGLEIVKAILAKKYETALDINTHSCNTERTMFGMRFTYNALIIACLHGNVKTVSELLNHGAKIDGNVFKNITPLMAAVGVDIDNVVDIKDRLEIIDMLLAHGADVNASFVYEDFYFSSNPLFYKAKIHKHHTYSALSFAATTAAFSESSLELDVVKKFLTAAECTPPTLKILNNAIELIYFQQRTLPGATRHVEVEKMLLKYRKANYSYSFISGYYPKPKTLGVPAIESVPLAQPAGRPKVGGP